jgi:hypothetical protein
MCYNRPKYRYLSENSNFSYLTDFATTYKKSKFDRILASNCVRERHQQTHYLPIQGAQLPTEIKATQSWELNCPRL